MTANVTLTNYLLLKRANTSVSSTYTGLVGEITIDTDLDTVRVHDGVTAGGHVLANVTQVNDSGNLSPVNANVAAANVQIDSLRANITAANVEITSLKANAAAQQIQIDNFAANTGFATLDQLTANINTVNANVGAFQVFSNANAGTQATSIDNLNANIGTYQTFANANVTVIQANLGAYQTYANANVVSIQANLGAYQTYANANAAAQTNEINNLISNAGVQATSINLVNANVTAANGAITALTANAATQAGLITSVNANVTAANAAIASLQSNAAVQQGVLDVLSGNAVTQTLELQQLTSNAAVQAANLTVLLANAVSQESSLTVLVSNAAAQSTAIDSINANLGAYQTYANANAATQATTITTLLSNAVAQAQSLDSLTTNAATQGASIINIDANLGTATTNITALQANAGAQGAAIESINANVGAYQTFANANAAAQAGSLTTLIANAVTQAQSLDSLTSNAATQAASINTIDANLGSATTNITSLQSNAGSQAAAIDSINANVGAYQTYANANAAAQAVSINTLIANAAAQQLAIDGFVTGTGFANINQLSANVDIINANIGAYQTYANANAAAQATGIDNINANLGSFQTYANIHFGDSNYGNTNVAAYLGVFNGNILPAANVTYSLGDSTHQWKDLWVSNNTIYIGNTPIRVDSGTLLVNGAPIATTVANLVNGDYTFRLFANGQSRAPDTVFAGNGFTVVDATGNIQGGIYNSGDAEYLNIGASTGRGFKFYVNDEDVGPLFFANGAARVPGELASATRLKAPEGNIGGLGMYGSALTVSNPAAAWLYLQPSPESYTYVQLPSDATANVSNVRIHNDIGNVEIGTGDGNITYYQWFFNQDGNLTIPGNINYANGTSILSGLGGAVTGNIAVGDGRINFVASSSGDGNGFSTIEIRPDDVYTSNENYLIIDPTSPNHIHIRAGGTQDNSNAELYLGGENSYFMVNNGLDPEVRISANAYVWLYGTDGNLTFPTGGSIIFDSSAISVIDGITNINAVGTVGANVIQVLSDLTSFGASPAPVIYGFRSISTTGSAVNEGNISASGNLVASQNAYVTGNVFAAQYNFANGVNILSTVGAGSYGNTEVAAYLPTYTGNISAGNVNVTNTVYAANIVTSGTSGNITGVNVISANTFVFAANGVNILTAAGGGTYGNTEVAAYLLTWPNIDVNILDTTSANITTLRANNFSTGNAVISGGYISALTNASIITATVTTLNSTGGNITTLRATNFSTANAVITGGYVNSLVNLTATTSAITNFSTGNAVISGGYISALTNASITTSVVTNFSTANAVITGGYATGLANVTATGNVTAGNLIGYGSNTTITAGSYTSQFLNNGAVITSNVIVSYMVTLPTTVSSLVSAAEIGAGARAFVTDADSISFGNSAVGGGANAVPVFSNGTGWFIG